MLPAQMLFLVLHLVGNAAFTLLVRCARSARFDYATVGTMNYATGALIGGAILITADGPVAWTWTPAAIVGGAVNGAQYQLTFLLMHALIGLGGIAVATSVLRLAIAVPVIASLFIWNEPVTAMQVSGLMMATIALPLLSGVNPNALLTGTVVNAPSRGRVALIVIVTLLVTGAGLLAAKVFAEIGRPAERPLYVASAYVTATIFSLATWKWQPRGEGRYSTSGRVRSLALGAVTGMVNLGQLSAFLPALATVPGVVAFPLAAAGGLLCTTLGGWFFFRERLTLRHGTGLGLALAAATLMNIRY